MLTDSENRLGNYTVTTNVGTLTVTAGSAPTLVSVMPSGGPGIGNTSVSVTGTGFESGATLSFGGIPATAVTVTSGATLTAVTPAGSTGLVNVVLTNPDHTTATLTNGYTYLGAPDLVPTSVSAPTALTAAHPNPSLSISWTVANQGTGPASGSWTDRVWFSTNGVLDANSIALGDFPITTTLAAGQNYSQTESVTLPFSASGHYTLFVQANVTKSLFEVNYANSISSPVSGQFTLTPPDLRILSVSGPSQAWTGTPFEVSWLETNSGAGPAAGHHATVCICQSQTSFKPTWISCLGTFFLTGQYNRARVSKWQIW